MVFMCNKLLHRSWFRQNNSQYCSSHWINIKIHLNLVTRMRNCLHAELEVQSVGFDFFWLSALNVFMVFGGRRESSRLNRCERQMKVNSSEILTSERRKT